MSIKINIAIGRTAVCRLKVIVSNPSLLPKPIFINQTQTLFLTNIQFIIIFIVPLILIRIPHPLNSFPLSFCVLSTFEMSSREITPENQKDMEIHVVGDDTPTQSISTNAIRQSARKRTVIVTPGFLPTQSDSRRALRTNVPPNPKAPLTSSSAATRKSTSASNI
jgi:hypothetical protein